VRRAVAAIVTVALVAGGAPAARAQESTGAGPTGADESARCGERLHTIAATLDADARRTRTWYWGWMAAGTTLLAGQTVLASLTTGNTQKDFIAGAATSTFIPAMLLLHPPRVLSDAPLLDARLAATAVDERYGDPCLALPRAQEILARDADDQALTTAWFAHVFVIGGNIAVGLILGLGFHDWFGAAKQAVGGSAVGELQILTLPTGALKLRGLGFAGSF
jgi:hypothetical protein